VEEGRRKPRLVGMSSGFLLRLTFAVLILVALTGAFVQLASGQRPVLLGGRGI
jgi:hypothetical protein